ncbi:MAG: efflux RND transporter periplasmic adaptor subunit [Pseudomonadales bacterium]
MNIQADGLLESDESKAAPTLKSRIVGLLQLLAVVVFIVSAVLFAREDEHTQVPAAAESVLADTAVKPLFVATLQPQSARSTLQVQTTGSVVVRNYVSLVSQITGRVESISPTLRPGGAFSAGQPMLAIDPQDFELAVAQAEADVSQARANLELLRAQSEAAITNYALLHGNKPVPPLVAKRPQIAQGEAQLDAAQARADIARLDLTRTTIALPFAGRVVESMAEVGQLLTRGQAFGRVFAVDAIEVVVPVSMEEVQKLAPVLSRTAQVLSESQVFRAQVSRQSAELDERTRFARLYLSFDENADLPPGAFVEVILEGPSVEDTFRLPIAAQQPGDGIWVVRQGKLSAATPQILDKTTAEIVVAAFDAAEGVVLGAVPGASEGLAVRTTTGP